MSTKGFKKWSGHIRMYQVTSSVNIIKFPPQHFSTLFSFLEVKVGLASLTTNVPAPWDVCFLDGVVGYGFFQRPATKNASDILAAQFGSWPTTKQSIAAHWHRALNSWRAKPRETFPGKWTPSCAKAAAVVWEGPDWRFWTLHIESLECETHNCQESNQPYYCKVDTKVFQWFSTWNPLCCLFLALDSSGCCSPATTS